MGTADAPHDTLVHAWAISPGPDRLEILCESSMYMVCVCVCRGVGECGSAGVRTAQCTLYSVLCGLSPMSMCAPKCKLPPPAARATSYKKQVQSPKVKKSV